MQFFRLLTLRRPYRQTVLALVFTLVAAASTFAQTGAAEGGETVRVTLLQVNDVYQISPVDRGKILDQALTRPGRFDQVAE